ncbi:(d)CMP kinase [bacterium CPR1]|nr:(d)CMP kinase [bacterium CPR1]
MKINIAIDGVAASGKTTVARLVAAELGLVYLETGAMYRAVTYQALQEGLDLHDECAVAALASRLSMRLVPDPAAPVGYRLFLGGGDDLSAYLHTPEVSRKVALVAQIPAVRRELVRMQKEMAARGGVVMAGRDIGTVVLPQAKVKIYLTASVPERARRRHLELGSTAPELIELEADLVERDRIDTSREDSPLRQAPDAVAIDSTFMTPQEVSDRIVALASNRV